MTIKNLKSNEPKGMPLKDSWDMHRFNLKLVNPANSRKFKILVVGTGLAGGGVATALGEKGYQVHSFCLQDSPRRAHSIAAQGGVNASKNYPNDGDSIWRLFYDTVKGGDFRGRESSSYRLAQVSNHIIDQAVAAGVPFSREYGGKLANRSFGGVQVSRTFYARGQTGQQLLLGVYSSLMKEVSKGHVTMHPRQEMMDLVLKDGRCVGIVTRNLLTGELEKHAGDVVVLATGGYCNAYYLSTNAMSSNGSCSVRAFQKGAYFANPSFTQLHPTSIPALSEFQSKQTLMSEALRNDGRIWVPKAKNDDRPANDIPEDDRDYYLERMYPAFGNLAPRDIASRGAKTVTDEGRGIGPTKLAVYLDFRDAIKRDGKEMIEDKYGNLFTMYKNLTGDSPYDVPMKIFPTAHFTMGGLWTDYNLMSNIPGLFVGGEANFSYHGANRLGANSLMSAMSDGLFVLPYTIPDYLARTKPVGVNPGDAVFEEASKGVKGRVEKLFAVKGTKLADYFHRKLGKIMWGDVGIARSEEGLKHAIKAIQDLKVEFWKDLNVPGENSEMNQELEKASRVVDFMDLGELMARDALERRESCGAHFRLDSVTEDNEAKRDDENFAHIAAWEYMGEGNEPIRNIEDLVFENIELAVRSYK